MKLLFENWRKHLREEEDEIVTAYHGSSVPIRDFDKQFSAQGVFWFSKDKDKILRGESGAVSTKWLVTAELKTGKVAGWAEYERYGLGELRDLHYDSVKLDDDWLILESKNIKVTGVEEIKKYDENPF